MSREKAPSGYVVADDRYLLRYVSETMPKLYKDAVQGIDAHYELYDYVTYILYVCARGAQVRE